MLRLQFKGSVYYSWYMYSALTIMVILETKWNTLVKILSQIFLSCSYYYGDTRDKWNTLVIILSLIFVSCSYYYGDTREQMEHIGKYIIQYICILWASLTVACEVSASYAARRAPSRQELCAGFSPCAVRLAASRLLLSGVGRHNHWWRSAQWPFYWANSYPRLAKKNIYIRDPQFFFLLD